MRGLSPTFASHILAVALAGVVVCPPAAAIEPVSLSGVIAGRVSDTSGIPQMGAVVMLYNRYERLVGKFLTNDRGQFRFESLLPDIYSVRVNLSSFAPALRQNISLQPGMRSFLSFNLNSVISSVELVYMSPGQISVMSDDWKWVVRSSGGTRPVLRYMPTGVDISAPQAPRRLSMANVFSDTRGVVKLSAGDSGDLGYMGTQADLGTAFALATSVYGSNQFAVSGNLGYASHTGIPTAGFRTSYSRESGAISPVVNVTMRQVFMPARVGAAVASGRGDNIPMLQTLDITFIDRHKIGDSIEIEYGSSLESVSFLQRLNYVSPFARLRWGSAENGSLEFAYSSGAPPTELLNRGEVADAELQHNLSTLAIFPRVTLVDGRAHVQRTENYELGYRRKIGSRTFTASAYRERTRNAAMNAVVPDGALGTGDVLPDLASNTSVVNAGHFNRTGYSATATQNFGEKTSATVAYGYAGALYAGTAPELMGSTASELRSFLRRTWRHSLTAKMSGTIPVVGTRYAASYQFTDYAVLHPVHVALTQRSTLEPGLNLYLKQPIPGISGILPGRLEATAELRNMLAQGYLPIGTPGGQQMLLIQSPRAIRGGLSFIF